MSYRSIEPMFVDTCPNPSAGGTLLMTYAHENRSGGIGRMALVAVATSTIMAIALKWLGAPALSSGCALGVGIGRAIGMAINERLGRLVLPRTGRLVRDTAIAGIVVAVIASFADGGWVFPFKR